MRRGGGAVRFLSWSSSIPLPRPGTLASLSGGSSTGSLCGAGERGRGRGGALAHRIRRYAPLLDRPPSPPPSSGSRPNFRIRSHRKLEWRERPRVWRRWESESEPERPVDLDSGSELSSPLPIDPFTSLPFRRNVILDSSYVRAHQSAKFHLCRNVGSGLSATPWRYAHLGGAGGRELSPT